MERWKLAEKRVEGQQTKPRVYLLRDSKSDEVDEEISLKDNETPPSHEKNIVNVEETTQNQIPNITSQSAQPNLQCLNLNENQNEEQNVNQVTTQTLQINDTLNAHSPSISTSPSTHPSISHFSANNNNAECGDNNIPPAILISNNNNNDNGDNKNDNLLINNDNDNHLKNKENEMKNEEIEINYNNNNNNNNNGDCGSELKITENNNNHHDDNNDGNNSDDDESEKKSHNDDEEVRNEQNTSTENEEIGGRGGGWKFPTLSYQHGIRSTMIFTPSSPPLTSSPSSPPHVNSIHIPLLQPNKEISSLPSSPPSSTRGLSPRSGIIHKSNQNNNNNVMMMMMNEERCRICDEMKRKEENYQLRCGDTYCMTCIHRGVKTNIEMGRMINMRCFNPTCRSIIHDDDIRRILTEEEMNTYLQFIKFSVIQDPYLRYCPISACSYLITDIRSSDRSNIPFLENEDENYDDDDRDDDRTNGNDEVVFGSPPSSSSSSSSSLPSTSILRFIKMPKSSHHHAHLPLSPRSQNVNNNKQQSAKTNHKKNKNKKQKKRNNDGGRHPHNHNHHHHNQHRKIENKVRCPRCKYDFCFECMRRYHCDEIESCVDYLNYLIDERKLEDFASYDVLFNCLQAKPCPSCRILIQKESGCNHIICNICQYEYCWACGEPYNATHFVTSSCNRYSSHIHQLRYQQFEGEAIISPLHDFKKQSSSLSMNSSNTIDNLQTLSRSDHHHDDHQINSNTTLNRSIQAKFWNLISFKKRKQITQLRKIKVVILGDVVGKSSFVDRFLHHDETQSQEIGSSIECTKDNASIYFNQNCYNLTIRDTPSLDEYSEIRSEAILKSSVFILMFSITSQRSFRVIDRYYSLIQRIKDQPRFPVVIVGNKVDLSDDRQITSDDVIPLQKKFYDCPYLEASAFSGFNVVECFFAAVIENLKWQEICEVEERNALNNALEDQSSK